MVSVVATPLVRDYAYESAIIFEEQLQKVLTPPSWGNKEKYFRNEVINRELALTINVKTLAKLDINITLYMHLSNPG